MNRGDVKSMPLGSRRGDPPLSSKPRSRRGRTRLWFVLYTAVLLAIAVVCVVTRQWSVAVTTLAIAVVFALFTRGLWRRR